MKVQTFKNTRGKEYLVLNISSIGGIQLLWFFQIERKGYLSKEFLICNYFAKSFSFIENRFLTMLCVLYELIFIEAGNMIK